MKRGRPLILAILIFSLCGCNFQATEDKDSEINITFSTTSKKVKQTVSKRVFGKIDGKEVYLFTMDNGSVKVSVTNYGGIITSIVVPDNKGHKGDVVLGYDSLDQYVKNNPYFGAIVGRYANRIARGQFTLDGKKYQLAINNGKNSLHGGLKGFDKVVWDVEDISDSSTMGLALTWLSKDGEEGFPGNLKVKVTYTLDLHDHLTTLIEAETDKATPVNLCNHTYFNLSEADTSVLGHHLTLYADQYTQVNDELIPTGVLPAVLNTPMDFNNSQQIGSRINLVKGGYDHNYVLAKKADELAMAAQLFDPRTGRQVEILTTQPGVQFYSGNFLDGTITGKKGKVYKKHYGLCLETQHFPDSPNQPSFPNTVLRPGQKYSQTTIYRFSVLK